MATERSTILTSAHSASGLTSTCLVRLYAGVPEPVVAQASCCRDRGVDTLSGAWASLVHRSGKWIMEGAVMQRTRRRVALVATLSVLGLVGGSLAAPAATAWNGKSQEKSQDTSRHQKQDGDHGHAGSDTLFVSKDGTDSGTCGPASDPCLTIGRAVSNASDGNRILVLPGTYAEMVIVDKSLSLRGTHVTIDATDQNNGIVLQGPGASNSTVSNFTVENAIGEGILATQVDGVTIANNRVTHNDQGISVPNSYPQCQAQGEIPGDCGEGLHVQATTNSRVVGNDVSENAGGILVSDDIAATHGNLIAYNKVTDNKPDCGITVPAHNPAAGVFDNTITRNWVTGNGEGGVLIAVGIPGGAAHDNAVTQNYLAGNGFAGVTIHAHFPGSNLDNNVIDGNLIKTNNVSGDDDAGVTDTTGVLIFSGDPSVHINGTSIRHNVIKDDHFGIWLSPGLVSDAGIANNKFINVDIEIQE
jgi:nitrous oxidase accessory protein NosD